MASTLDVKARFDRIVARLPVQNLSNTDAIEASLAKTDKTPICLWVTSPTGKPHLGYFVPLLKLADFLEAGVEVRIILLDTYSFLDNVDYPMDQVAHRAKFYQCGMTAALQCLGIDGTDVKFVLESSYQTPDFTKDLWRLCTKVQAQTIRDSWDRAVHPEMVSPLMCPLLQLLSEEYNDADFQFGGEDQASIFALIEKFGPELGHRPRGHLMNPMLPNLTGKKMSATHADKTKIMLLETPENIIAKMEGAAWQTESSKNAFLMTLRDVLIPLSELHARPTAKVIPNWVNPSVDASAPAGTVFTATTDDGLLHFSDFADIGRALSDGRIEPDMLKKSVAAAVAKLFTPMQGLFDANPEWQTASAGGYPTV